MLHAATSTRTQALWCAAVAALAVVAAGLLVVPYYGDQALYAVIGRDVLAGRPLYTGIWDIKQPGIFLWYGLLGGVPLVTRAADVIVAVATAVLVGVLVRPHVPPLVACWTPVAAAAVLLLPVRALDLGQVEQLVALPSVAALVLVTRGAGRRARVRPLDLRRLEQLTALPQAAAVVLSLRALGRRVPAAYGNAGLVIGIVAVFKLWAAAVPLAAVLVWVGFQGERRRSLLLLAGGAALPVAAVLVWLAATGSLAAALATWFVAPAEQLAQPGARTWGRLASGAGRYLLLTLPVVLLAAARLPRAWRRRDRLDLALFAWLAAALAVIAVQLWWSYHWVLLTPALLALAARQAGELGRHRLVAAGLAGAALPLLAVGLGSPERPLVHGNGVTAASRATIAADLGNAPRARAELAAAGVTAGQSLYVLGDATYQDVHGTPYPVRLNGWTSELFTDAQWAELASTLDSARPQWVFLENYTRTLTADRGRAVLRVLDDHYTRVRSSDAGDFYRLGRP